MMKGTRAALAGALLLLAAAWGAEAMGPSIRVGKTSMRGGEWVDVYFSGVEKAERNVSGCFIGVFIAALAEQAPKKIPALNWVYSPPVIDPQAIKFINCTDADQSGKFNQTGDGYHRFNLLNYREPVNFWLFYGGVNDPVAMAKSESISFIDEREPMQGRIQRTDKLDEMRVTWNSAVIKGQSVHWGPSPSTLTHSAPAVGLTIQKHEFCGPPANHSGYINPGWTHTAVITGLMPATKYYYQFGDLSTNSTSGVYSFVSAPTPTAHMRQQVFLIGDVGVTEPDETLYHWPEEDAWATKRGIETAMSRTDPDMLLHIGDIAYATGYEAKWEAFMHSIVPIATAIPYMVSWGNHELDWPNTQTVIGSVDSGGECGLGANMRFHVPGETPTMPVAHRDNWYSLNQGNIHFTVINTEVDLKVGSRQYEWVKKDLGAVDRRVTPWVIFGGHRPMYWANNYSAHFSTVEPLLMENKVDIAIWGHVHAAQLTWPVYKGKRVHKKDASGYDAPVHCLIGNGGQNKNKLNTTGVDWSRWAPETQYWGWNKVVAHNATHLTFYYHHNGDNALTQTLDLVRGYPRV